MFSEGASDENYEGQKSDMGGSNIQAVWFLLVSLITPSFDQTHSDIIYTAKTPGMFKTNRLLDGVPKLKGNLQSASRLQLVRKFRGFLCSHINII